MADGGDRVVDDLPASSTGQRSRDAAVPAADTPGVAPLARTGGLGGVLSRADGATVIRVLGQLQRHQGNRAVSRAAGAVGSVQRLSDDALIGEVPREMPVPGAPRGKEVPAGSAAPPGEAAGARAAVPRRGPGVPRPARKPLPGAEAGQPGRPRVAPPATAADGEDRVVELPPEFAAVGPHPAGAAAPPPAGPPGGATPGAAQAAAIAQEIQQLDGASDAALQQALADIDTAAAALRARAADEVAQRESRLHGTYEAQRALLQTQVAGAIASVQGRRAAEQQVIRHTAEQQRQRLAEAANGEREGAAAHVISAGGEVRTVAAAEAARARAESAKRAAQIRAAGAAAPAGGDAARTDAQRTSNRKIADKAAMECLDTGAHLASSVQAEASGHAARSYTELRAGFDREVSKAAREGDQAVEHFAAQAVTRADEIADGALAVIRGFGAHSLAALDRQREAGSRELARWRQQVHGTLDALIPRLRGPLEQGRAVAHANLRAYVNDVLVSLAASTDHERAARQAEALRGVVAQARSRLVDEPRRSGVEAGSHLTSALAEPLAGLESLTVHLTTAATDTGADLTGKVHAAGADAQAGLDRSTATFTQQVGAAVSSAVGDLAQAGQRFRSEVEAPHQQLLDRLRQLVDDGLASEDRTVADAREKMRSTAGQIGSRYDQLKGEAERRNAAEQSVSRIVVQRGLWDRIKSAVGGFIDSVRNWFTATFGEFWGGLLFGVLAAIAIVLVGIAAAYVVGQIVGAVIATAKIAAIVTAVIIIAGAVGLGIYNRFREFEADNPGQSPSFWEGLGLVGLGVADLTGIPFIIEGAVGQRAFGRDLSESERGERIGMGIVFLATAGLAAYKGVPSLLRGKPRGRPGARAPEGARSGEQAPARESAGPEQRPSEPAREQPGGERAAPGDPQAFGKALGEEIRAMPRGKRAAIAQRVTEAGFSQADAVTAANIASQTAFGRTATVSLPDGRVAVISVLLGDGKPIFVVEANGAVRPARATLSVRTPPDPNNPIEVTNVELE